MVKDLKVSFPDGNIINKANETCNCPNDIVVEIQDLIPGRKYTVYIQNLNNTPVRTFPESFSFVAKEEQKRVSFYYQFV
jgi:hypothetical protein